jgi:hypothetical protein
LALWGKLPEFAIMPEKYPSTRSLQPGELIEGSQHCLAVMETLRQLTFAQGPAEIAGISARTTSPDASRILRDWCPRVDRG